MRRYDVYIKLGNEKEESRHTIYAEDAKHARAIVKDRWNVEGYNSVRLKSYPTEQQQREADKRYRKTANARKKASYRVSKSQAKAFVKKATDADLLTLKETVDEEVDVRKLKGG